MFPGGSAGSGLIILRMSAVGSILGCACAQGHFGSAGWAEFAIGALVSLVGIGFLTPVACGVGVLLEFSYLLYSHGVNAWNVALALFTTLSLALLGPGAFSLDARFFGRRRVI
jgi:uncharacterized membrane protein YphA (DoxX/SURF4 family)